MSEAEKEAGEGFLSRWSRRKREVLEAPAAPPAESPVAEAMPLAVPDSQAEPAAPPAERAACPIPDIPEVDPASLPPIESLTAESDFAAFLKPGVPTLLRNAALRRMWSLDPAIRDYVGPLDYQWDFNTPGGLPFGFANELTGDISKLLAQAIGKIEELAEDKPGEGEAAEASKAAMSDSAPTGPAAEPPEPEEAPPALVAEGRPAIEPAPVLPEPEPAPAPRRRHGGALPG